jgi:hypothetical protein
LIYIYKLMISLYHLMGCLLIYLHIFKLMAIYRIIYDLLSILRRKKLIMNRVIYWCIMLPCWTLRNFGFDSLNCYLMLICVNYKFIFHRTYF